MTGFIRADDGYWGAQLVAPYVDEEVSLAIRAHQSVRFDADEAAGSCPGLAVFSPRGAAERSTIAFRDCLAR